MMERFLRSFILMVLLFSGSAYGYNSWSNPGMASQNYKYKIDNSIPTDGWSVNVERTIVPIIMSGIVVPVFTSTDYYIENPSQGNFHYNSATNSFTSAVEIDVIKRNVPPSGTVYDYRPTLYVSIPGAKLTKDLLDSGNWIQPWQNSLERMLGMRYPSSSSDHEYMHIQLNWATMRNNRFQVGEAASRIKSILSDKTHKWDVVVIGFSRGGVFAHELSKKIVGHDKVNTLTSVLLDPTAATTIGDRYPNSKVSSDSNKFTGFLYSNNEIFEKGTDFDSSNSWLTVDERPIPSYERNNNISGKVSGSYTIRNSSGNLTTYNYSNRSIHSEFAGHWLYYDSNKHSPYFDRYGFDFLYDYIYSKKVKGSFSADGFTGVKVVRVSVEDLVVDVSLNVGPGYINGNAEFSVGSFTAQGYFNVSDEGFDAQASVLLTQSFATINASKVEYTEYLGDYTVVEFLYDGGLYFGNSYGYFDSEIDLTSGTIDLELEFNGVPGLPIKIDSDDVNVNLSNVITSKPLEDGFHNIKDDVDDFKDKIESFFSGW